jgi:hypothetical protein
MWEFAAPAVGDAVLAADGTWSSPQGDHTAILRKAWLTAKSLGLGLYIPGGYYIVTGSIVLSGECFDNCTVRGETGYTWIVGKTASQPVNFAIFDFDGKLEVDGVNASHNPSYYLTAPATASSDIITLNTTSGLTLGEPLMLMDMTHGIYQYFGSTAGDKIAIFGQVSQITQLGTDPPDSRTVAATGSTYDNDTGAVSLKTTASFPIGQNIIIRVSGLTGTGDNLSELEGDYRTLTGTGGTIIQYLTDDSLGTDITITGGTVQWGILASNQVRIKPALEANYAGTSTDPYNNSTCIRRLSSSPINLRFSGINFTYDSSAPGLNTQVKVRLRSLTRPRIWDCEFWGIGQSISVGDGTHQFDIENCSFFEGGNAGMNMTFGTGAYMGRVTRCRGYFGRHHTNTTSGLTTSTAAHIVVRGCHAFGMSLSSFTDHPGVRNQTWIDCLAVGGPTPLAAGFQMRGLQEAAINCRVYGYYYGVHSAAGSSNMVDGGLFYGCVIGARITRAPYTQLKNFPRFVNCQIAGVFIDNVVDDDKNVPPPSVFYQIPFPGLRVEAEFEGDIPLRGDVVYCLRGTTQPPAFGSDWRFNCRAVGRSVKYGCSQLTFVVSNFIWPGEYGVGVGTKFASWVCPAGLEAHYVADSTNASAAIVATIPDPALYPGSKLWFRKLNTGGQTVSLTGYPVDGVSNPVIPDGGSLGIISNVQTYRIASTGSTYTSASGAILLAMSDANDISSFVGASITLYGLTGTGDLAGIQGTFTIDAGSSVKTLRCHAPTGKGTIVITGGWVSFGGWCKI